MVVLVKEDTQWTKLNRQRYTKLTRTEFSVDHVYGEHRAIMEGYQVTRLEVMVLSGHW